MGSIDESTRNGKKYDYDVLCIGAGLAGIYTLYRLRELGLSGITLESGTAEGGTWYWNRYPGARFDSESYSYQYFFDQDTMNSWQWEEHFAGQPEILRYINHVVEKHNLRKDMRFDTKVVSAVYNDTNRIWTLTDQHGKRYTSRWLIPALGILTNPTLPNIPGVADYKGQACHTSRWPKIPVSFENKRVAVIGTGATGIQTITEVAKTVGHLTVFQRTANWACPLHNSKIDDAEMERLRAYYPEMMEHCSSGAAGFLHEPYHLKTTDVSPEEREARWEELYNTRGFGIWFSNFSDIGSDREANRLASEFIAKKIRQRVHDPVTAEKLVPKTHGFTTRRVPLESGYFEVYNQSNVRLIDLNETPIEKITEKGIRTAEEELEFDIIIYATGFDAIVGSYDAIDFQGLEGVKLKDLWEKGPKTYLGLAVPKFPNMLMVMGPHQAFGNNPRSIEYASFWITEAIRYFEDRGITKAEATDEMTEKWYQHVVECSKGSLSGEVDSWMTGINKNVGRTTRYVARYSGTNQMFRKWCNDVRDNKYYTLRLE